jgi:hypothetical protein
MKSLGVHCEHGSQWEYDPATHRIRCADCGHLVTTDQATELFNARTALLRDVEQWTALDGDGISQPLLDRVREASGLPPLDPPRRY